MLKHGSHRSLVGSFCQITPLCRVLEFNHPVVVAAQSNFVVRPIEIEPCYLPLIAKLHRRPFLRPA